MVVEAIRRCERWQFGEREFPHTMTPFIDIIKFGKRHPHNVNIRTGSSAYFKEISLGDQMDIMICNMRNTIVLLPSSICVRHKTRRSGLSAPYRCSGQRPGSQRFYWDLKEIARTHFHHQNYNCRYSKFND